MSTIAFYLDAPMQSWGASSRYTFRETCSFPTKSAIVGLLSAAIGIDKNKLREERSIAPLSNLRMTAVKLEKTDSEKHIRTTRLNDFHTVGGGYDYKASAWEKSSVPKKASGAPFGTVITRRAYLTDSTFSILLEGEPPTLEVVHRGLLDPVWGVWLGRKHCIPATPMSPTLAETPQAALDSLLAFLPKYSPKPLQEFEYQQEVDDDQAVFYQSDQPVAFGQHHGPIPAPYRSRGIVHHRP